MTNEAAIAHTAHDVTSDRKRRNALTVSASVAAAAFMGLKIPSLTAEFSQLNSVAIAPGSAWIVAAALVFYLLARYHFSGGRSELWDELWKTHMSWVTRHIEPAIYRAFRTQRLRKLEELAQPKSELVFREDKGWNVARTWHGADFQWSINSQPHTADGLGSLAHHSDYVSRVRMPARTLFLHAITLPVTVLWSRVAWEMNVVYGVAIAAISMSIYRAHFATAELDVPWCLVLF